MKIRLFVTGGTFDKEYNEFTGKLFFKDTHIAEVLKMGRCNIDLSIRTLMMVDSRDMSDIDRKIIKESCKRCKEEKIVITHGTDTMVETAEFLAKEMELEKKGYTATKHQQEVGSGYYEKVGEIILGEDSELLSEKDSTENTQF